MQYNGSFSITVITILFFFLIIQWWLLTCWILKIYPLIISYIYMTHSNSTYPLILNFQTTWTPSDIDLNHLFSSFISNNENIKMYKFSWIEFEIFYICETRPVQCLQYVLSWSNMLCLLNWLQHQLTLLHLPPNFYYSLLFVLGSQ